MIQAATTAGPQLAEHYRPLDAVLRSGKVGGFEAVSDFAACLMPLLNALGWRGSLRHLVEAMPHFANTLDLVGVRNVLAALNYQSRAAKITLPEIDPRLLPCLFVPRQGSPIVVLEATAEGLRVFDGQSGNERILSAKRLKGTAYLVDPAGAEQIAQTAARGDWVEMLARRFKPLFLRMLGITFALNLLALVVPLFVMNVYDKVIGNASLGMLQLLLAGVILALICDLGLRLVRARILAYVAARVTSLVGAATFRQILFLPAAYTEMAPTSSQVTRLKEFESVRDFFTGPFATVGLELPFVLIFIGVIGWLAGPLATVPVVMLVCFLAAGLILVPAMKRRASQSSKARSARQSFVVETLQNLRTIKQLSAEHIWAERYRQYSAEAALSNFHAAQVTFLMQTIAHVIMMAAGIATLAIGTLQVMSGDMTVGGLIATMALVWRVLSPLQTAFVTLTRLEQIKLGLKQVNQLMRIKTERDPSDQVTPRRRFAGALSLARISMRYNSGGEPALLGVAFDIKPGELVAITGPSGAGKSTILKVLGGLYQPQAGTVHIDGLDIRQLDPLELRYSIAYLPQICHLFHGTIAQNIRLAEPTASDEDLERACAAAGVLEDIQALPEGFDTRIGDQILQQLPSGFQQRLSLARCYAKDSSILLLDEPGQTLDEVGDAKFMAHLEKLRGLKTVVMITHRPSHMRMADRLLVVEEGRVAMDGPPDQVLQQIPRGAL